MILYATSTLIVIFCISFIAIPNIRTEVYIVMSSRLKEHARMAWLPWAAANSWNRTLHAVGSQSYGKYTQNESAGSCSSLTCARQSHESARGHLIPMIHMSVAQLWEDTRTRLACLENVLAPIHFPNPSLALCVLRD